jgi:hypothetical protein
MHNEVLNVLYFSPQIFYLIKSRKINLVEHVACRLTGESYTGFWWGKQSERFHLGTQALMGRCYLRWIFRKWDVEVCPGMKCLSLGAVGRHFEIFGFDKM